MDDGLSNFMKRIQLETVKVEAMTVLTENVYVLSWNRLYNFLPGQVVAVSTNKRIPPRLYSICSGKDDAELSILFTMKPDGALTPRLAKLHIGDTLLVSAPFGAFLGDNNPAWWIASGTGIAPYRSMLRSGFGSHNTLIHGGRSLSSFYFADEIKQSQSVGYVRCCSQEAGEGVFHGRLTQWMQQQEIPTENNNFYLCGSSEMVVEVRDILVSKGVEMGRIMSEIYF